MLAEKKELERFIKKQNEAIKKMLLLFIENKHGLYAAEIADKLNANESRIRDLLAKLEKDGILESKKIDPIFYKGKQTKFVFIPEDADVIDKNKNYKKESLKKGYCTLEASEYEIVINKESFRIPVLIKRGSFKVKIYKIKEELFKTLSEIL